LDEDYCPSYKNREQRKEYEEGMEVKMGLLAKEAGVTYLIEGTHTFVVKSGATFTVYASPYTPEFSRWGFPYKDRFNTSEQIPKNQLCPNPLNLLRGTQSPVFLMYTS
jgi:hypothetical protein